MFKEETCNDTHDIRAFYQDVDPSSLESFSWTQSLLTVWKDRRRGTNINPIVLSSEGLLLSSRTKMYRICTYITISGMILVPRIVTTTMKMEYFRGEGISSDQGFVRDISYDR